MFSFTASTFEVYNFTFKFYNDDLKRKKIVCEEIGESEIMTGTRGEHRWAVRSGLESTTGSSSADGGHESTSTHPPLPSCHCCPCTETTSSSGENG